MTLTAVSEAPAKVTCAGLRIVYSSLDSEKIRFLYSNGFSIIWDSYLLGFIGIDSAVIGKFHSAGPHFIEEET
jgi:hypothetical protein